MNVTSLRIRRSLTLLGAVAALLLGYAAIQAAAAWTADAAPLTVSPASARSIETRLADEQARSAALQAQLEDLTGNADDLAAALAAAQDQIKADDSHAAQLEKDLAAATKKLQDLQKSIKAAAARTVVTRTVVATATTTTSRASHGGEHEHEHEGGDD
jgi:chromosome segregation ATPase